MHGSIFSDSGKRTGSRAVSRMAYGTPVWHESQSLNIYSREQLLRLAGNRDVKQGEGTCSLRERTASLTS